MNSAIRTLDEHEVEQVSGGLEVLGYFVDVDLLNYGDGEKLMVSWGETGGDWDYVQFDLNCQ